MASFSFDEAMRGVWWPSDQPSFRRPAQFRCLAIAKDAARYLRDGRLRLEGQVRIEGLAGLAPCQGSLDILLPWRRLLKYDISFVGDDGRPYRFLGEKRVRYLDFTRTMTELSARLVDAQGSEIGGAELSFDLRTLPAMLWSFLQSLRGRGEALAHQEP